MSSTLHEERFDFVVVGTGLVESMLAAGLATAGKRVLHVDQNEFYGSGDASLTLRQFAELESKLQDEKEQEEVQEKEQEQEEEQEEEQEDNEDSVSAEDTARAIAALSPDAKLHTLERAPGICGFSVSGLQCDDSAERVHFDAQQDAKQTAEQEIQQALEQAQQATENGSQQVSQHVTKEATEESAGFSDQVADSTDQATQHNQSIQSSSESESTAQPEVTTAPNIDQPIDQQKEIVKPDTPNSWESLWKQGYRTSLDLCPRMVLCRGVLVDTLVRSGVSTYMEFKALDAVFVSVPGDNKHKNDELSTFECVRAPCSKSEIFRTKDLRMVEKRQLMKFLQYCADQAIKDSQDDKDAASSATAGVSDSVEDSNATDGEDGALAYVNENKLNQGRALSRPQNKKLDTILDPKAASANTFQELLADSCGLSSRLQDFVMYGMALLAGDGTFVHDDIISNDDTDSDIDKDSVRDIKLTLPPCIVSPSEGIACAQPYLGALGRYGGTAFLCPMYGVGELAQGFTRKCAVSSGVYMLRQRKIQLVMAPTVTDGNTETEIDTENVQEGKTSFGGKVVGVVMDEGEVVLADHVIIRPELMPSSMLTQNKRCIEEGVDVVENENEEAKEVARKDESDCVEIFQEQLMCVCDQTVVTAAATTRSTNTKSASADSSAESRVLMIIPPMSAMIDNPFAIHVTQLDSGTHVVPSGFVAIYLSTLSCHDDNNDQHAFETSDNYAKVERTSVLERALRVLVDKAANNNNLNKASGLKKKSPIVWARVLKRRLVGTNEAASMSNSNLLNASNVGLNVGVHVIPDRTESRPMQLELDLRHVVRRAELMFNELLPGEIFLPAKAVKHDEVSADDDYALSAMERLRLPQLVDLTFYQYLGGVMEGDDKAEFLSSSL